MENAVFASLQKLKVGVSDRDLAQYSLALTEGALDLNSLLGKQISLSFAGEISCIKCARVVSKTFAQGFCYTCFRRVPEADLCIVRPEICHFHMGTCRDSAWGLAHCFVSHTVYLANSSGLKVGITRTQNEQTRWIDQGAVQAVPIARVSKRLDAGAIEAGLRKHVSDKTNWRLLLKKDTEHIDLEEKRSELLNLIPENLAYEALASETVRKFSYPVLGYPQKLKTFDLQKDPHIEGTLIGIKGQYLLFDEGVFNVRKFAGYKVKVQIH